MLGLLGVRERWRTGRGWGPWMTIRYCFEVLGRRLEKGIRKGCWWLGMRIVRRGWISSWSN